MLTQIYIEALLVDKELADHVWEAWDAEETDDQVAWLAWWLIVRPPNNPPDVVFDFFLDGPPQFPQ